MSEVELWLYPDLFHYGIVFAHPKLTVPYLKKVVSYAKAKAREGGYPYLSWLIWKHMAVNKMLMDENLAWTYFQIFYTLKSKPVKERLEFAELQQQLAESQNSTSYKQHMKVSTLEFVLFLFMQQANKVSLRKSLMGEEWPGCSPRLESPVHSSRSDVAATTVDERKHIHFVLSHFSQIIDILTDGNKTKTFPQQGPVISVEVVKALGYLIHGRIRSQSVICNLYDIAIRHRIQNNSGYLRATDCFSMLKFEQWLTKVLGENPFGLASCITSGIRLNWADLSPRKENQRRKAKIAINSLSAPNDSKLIVFSQCSNQTVARQTALLNGACVKIHRCHFAFVYLLSPLKSVSIEKCIDTSIVLGPVSMCIKLISCQNVTLIAPCQSVIVSSSNGITLHVTTPTQPIIFGDNSLSLSEPPVILAPYNTFYADLENHLAMVGLAVSPNTNQWNNPICVDNRSNMSLSHSRINDGLLSRSSKNVDGVDSCSSEHDSQFYRLMNSSDFYTFSIPFRLPKTTSGKHDKNFCITEEIPGGLPKEYAQAVRAKQRGTERWKKAVKKSNMTKEERTLFQKLVEEKFKEWVLDTSHQRQLDDLGQGKLLFSTPVQNA